MRRIPLLLLIALTFCSTLEAADIVVIKGKKKPHVSYLPNRGGRLRCLVTRPSRFVGLNWDSFRQIHIQGPIDVFDSVRLKQALESIELDKDVKAITISICSPGGVYFEAPKMIDVIRAYAKENNVKIITSAVGRGAWSAAAMVWLAGDCAQIARGNSAVGFHAAYDPRDKSKAKQLVPQIQSLIRTHIKRMSAGAFEFGKDSFRPKKLKRDTKFIADSIADYISIAFDAKGPGGFLVIKSDFTVDLWEQRQFTNYTSKWPTEHGTMVESIFGIFDPSKKARNESLASYQNYTAEKNYNVWYENGTEHTSAIFFGKRSTEYEVKVPAVFQDTRFICSQEAKTLLPHLLLVTSIPPHVLFDWKTPMLATPYREYGEYFFWYWSLPYKERPEKFLNLSNWLAQPIYKYAPFSILVPKKIRLERARKAAAAKKAKELKDKNLRETIQLRKDLLTQLVSINNELPKLNYRHLHRGKLVQHTCSGQVDDNKLIIKINDNMGLANTKSYFNPLQIARLGGSSKIRHTIFFGSRQIEVPFEGRLRSIALIHGCRHDNRAVQRQFTKLLPMLKKAVDIATAIRARSSK